MTAVPFGVHLGSALLTVTARMIWIGRLSLAAAALALVLGALPAAVRPVLAAGPAPKVVLIVGPAGSATERYRELAEEAAAAAARHTPNVVRLYSPDATWPAVKQALDGASLVVYLGHGNGWPSPYRDSLTGSTQNGFGLNPHAGAGDVHQYFGESRIAAEVELAANAVVVLSHLCYASGNAEPGIPEGSLEVGQQRVDNYAAGFLAAGASAVIAEAHMGPAYYVDAILAGKESVDRIWRGAPTANGHVLAFDSQRSKGYTAQMDPDEADAGFHRSIVLHQGLTAAEVLAGATGAGRAFAPFEPTLAGLGISFRSGSLAAPPTAGSTTTLRLPVAVEDADLLPSGLMVGTRWDALDDPAAPPPVTPPAEPSPAAGPSGSPGVGPSLVLPERPGDVVDPVAAERADDALLVPVRIPSRPGLYRLVATVHGKDGLAFDAATQALLPALVVRVTGTTTAAYLAPATAAALADDTLTIDVTVTNLGARPWGRPIVQHRIGQAETEPASRAAIVARWVDLTGLAGSAPAAGAALPAGMAPGGSATLTLSLRTPELAGQYLLVIDVVVPRVGSLAAAGVPPGIVSVTID